MPTQEEVDVKLVEGQIAHLLSQLERNTGQLVVGLSLNSIEVTNMHDERPVHQMKVCIELERLPGHQW